MKECSLSYLQIAAWSDHSMLLDDACDDSRRCLPCNVSSSLVCNYRQPLVLLIDCASVITGILVSQYRHAWIAAMATVVFLFHVLLVDENAALTVVVAMTDLCSPCNAGLS